MTGVANAPQTVRSWGSPCGEAHNDTEKSSMAPAPTMTLTKTLSDTEKISMEMQEMTRRYLHILHCRPREYIFLPVAGWPEWPEWPPPEVPVAAGRRIHFEPAEEVPDVAACQVHQETAEDEEKLPEQESAEYDKFMAAPQGGTGRRVHHRAPPGLHLKNSFKALAEEPRQRFVKFKGTAAKRTSAEVTPEHESRETHGNIAYTKKEFNTEKSRAKGGTADTKVLIAAETDWAIFDMLADTSPAVAPSGGGGQQDAGAPAEALQAGGQATEQYGEDAECTSSVSQLQRRRMSKAKQRQREQTVAPLGGGCRNPRWWDQREAKMRGRMALSIAPAVRSSSTNQQLLKKVPLVFKLLISPLERSTKSV